MFALNLIQQFLFIELNLATFVEGDQKAPFSIATTPRCRGGHYSYSSKNLVCERQDSRMF